MASRASWVRVGQVSQGRDDGLMTAQNVATIHCLSIIRLKWQKWQKWQVIVHLLNIHAHGAAFPSA